MFYVTVESESPLPKDNNMIEGFRRRLSVMDVDRFDWLEIRPMLADQVKSQFSDCCWAIVCSFCVSSKYIIDHNISDPEWLSSQYLIDYALEPFRDYANIDPLTGEVIFDQYNCDGLRPVASLMFARQYGIGFAADYRFFGGRNLIPRVRPHNERRVYIRGFTRLLDFQEGLNEEIAYEYLRNTGPMMCTVLVTNEFRDYKGTRDGSDGIIRVEGTAGVDLAHSVTIIGMDRTMRCFRIQNSYALEWGDYGKGWILYELVYDILSIGMTSLDPTDNYVYPTQDFSFAWYRDYYAFGAPGPRCHKDLKEYNDPAKPDLPHLLEWYFRSGLDRCIWIIGMISAYCHPNVEKWMEKLKEFEINRRLTIRTCIVAVALFVLFLMYHYFAATEIYNAVCMFIAAYVWMTGFGNFSYFYMRQDFIVARFAQMMWRLNIFVAFACIVLNNDYMLSYICPMHTLFTLMVYGALGMGNKYNEIRSAMIMKICTCFLLVILIWEVPEVFDLLWFPLTFLLEYNDPAKPDLPRFHESHFRFRVDRYTWIIGMIYAYCHLNVEKWMEKLESSEIKRRLTIRTCIVAVTLSVGYLWYGYTCKLDKVTYRSNMPNGQPKWLLCLIPDYSVLSLMLMTAIYILISCCLFEMTNSPESLFLTTRDNHQLLYNFLAGAGISAFMYLIAFILVQIIT